MFKWVSWALACLVLSGCAVTRVGESLPYGILNNDDVALVRDGLPSYLLVVDGLIVNWPESADLLRSGATLYGAYATLVADEPERAASLAAKSLGYAARAACLSHKGLCEVKKQSVPELESALGRLKARHLPALYSLGTSWAGYIQTHSSDWNAVADLARVRALLERVVALDDGYEQGQAHLYLGVLDSLLPEALGGQPEAARVHFEAAVRLSGERNLMAKTLYAQHYARMQFDRDLHDRLLNEVLAAPASEHGLTLQNTLAQQQARTLLDEADDYF